MNPITKAVAEIKYRVPRAILEKVFIDGSTYWRSTQHSSIEKQIETLVIRPRVLVDCNLIGGTQALIPLEGLERESPTVQTTVIHIPKDRTRGLSINSVLNVSFFNSASGVGFGGGGGYGGGVSYSAGQDQSAMMAAAAGVMSSFDKIPMTSTSRVQLIAENTILITDSLILPPGSVLRCILADDESLSSLQLRSYRHFSTLVEHAVKAYIYNALIVEMDTAELRYGQGIGMFKEIVSGYADANQNYQDYLRDVWEAVAFMNDDQTYRRYAKLMLGGNR